jgi:hypothetical protein
LGPLACVGHSYYGGPYDYPGTAAAAAVAVADVNGDGKLDLVSTQPGVLAGSGFVSVLLQAPGQPGGFQGPFRSAAGVNPGNLAVASLGGSAGPAVAVVNGQVAVNPSAANTVSVLLPNSAQPGAFLAPVTLPLGTRNPVDVAMGDLTGSGSMDIAVAADGGNDLLVFFQGATPGSFNAPVSLALGGAPTAVAMGDLTGAGQLDLVAATSANSVSVLLHDPANPGRFLGHVDYPVGAGPVAVKIADLLGNQRPALAVVNYGASLAPTTQGLSVLLQDPAAAGTFQAAVTYATGDYNSDAVAVADLNNDGLLDLVVANYGLRNTPGSLSVFLQDPAHRGAFLSPSVYPGSNGPTSVAIGDLNGDGLPDLASADGDIVVRYQVAGQPGVFGPPVHFPQ